MQDQLSKEHKEQVQIVPKLSEMKEDRVPFLQLLPPTALLVMQDFTFVHDTIECIYNEGFAKQVMQEQFEGATEVEQRELMHAWQKEQQLISGRQFLQDMAGFKRIQFGLQSDMTPQVSISFDITPQPLFHKNFDLLYQTLADYAHRGYALYVFAESGKQVDRLREIMKAQQENNSSTPIPLAAESSNGGGGYLQLQSPSARPATEEGEKGTVKGASIHAGYIDHQLKICCFTDHQIFERFHKYNLKSDKARAGKMVLTLKELQEMEPGDFIVHVDFGIGKFGGLVRVPTGNTYQEMIRIIYQRGDIVDVSIHALYKISKYRRSDTGEPPRLSTLGTGAWERLKEKAKKRIKLSLIHI